MKIRFIDANDENLRYNVGDIFDGHSLCSDDSESDISELKFEIDGEPAAYVYNKNTGRREIGWSLHCQDVFLIVDQETNQILYTSKKYDRCHRHTEFIEELREAIDHEFNIAPPSKFELSSEVEFMDI
jgi:hypothetical protein